MCVKGLCQHCSSGDGFQLWDMNLQHFSWSNLTASASSPLSVSPQRIFNSFVYTEKTSNGETEVQQVSNKGFSFPLCVCVCVCVCVPVCACMCHGWCVLVATELNTTQDHRHTRTCTRHQREKKGFIKILRLLSHWLWSSLSVFPLVSLPRLTMWAQSCRQAE